MEEPRSQFDGHEKKGLRPWMDFFFSMTTVLHLFFSPRFAFCTSTVSGVLAETGSYMYFWFLVCLYWMFAGYYTAMYESRHGLRVVKDEHTVYYTLVLAPNREMISRRLTYSA
jgi:hypothetical protein